ncbi:MAG TPA: amidohydrolase family protein [Candidatus Acidoferrales bacterium]|nr:amidohydrolase family protein [Candidatus Acidoferrales bacterium]
MRRAITFFTLLLSSLIAIPTHAQTVAIRAGNLIDPATGSVAKNQIILIKDQKITDVGPNVAIPSGAQVIDLSNEWIMPGIMDSHTHVTFLLPDMSTPLEENYLEVGRGMRVLQGLKIAQTLLNAGITTIRDVGNEAGYASVDVRNAINKGWFTGPTILTSGKIIAPFGGQSSGTPPEVGPIWRYEYIDADGPQEIRKAVRENIFYGADLIKLVSDNSDYFYSEDEIRAAADEAHKAGRALAVHCYKKEEANNVINGGADSLEHGWHLTDAQLQLMKSKGTFLAGTEFPEAHFVAGGYPDGKAVSAAALDRLHRAYLIGVKLVFSTDIVSAMPGESRADMTWDYLAGWRTAGVPNAAVLKAMTTNAAELLRIQKERGAITAGLYADIIAMPANPLDDTEALRKVNFVMKNGAVVRSSQIAQ